MYEKGGNTRWETDSGGTRVWGYEYAGLTEKVITQSLWDRRGRGFDTQGGGCAATLGLHT